jgi:hypothetical protein
MNMNYTTKRHEYGIVIDKLPVLDEIPYSKTRKRVNDLRKQVRALNYKGINSTAELLYQQSAEYESRYGLRKGSKPSTLSAKRYHLLCSTQGIVALCNNYDEVKWDITTALQHGTPVAVYCTRTNPDMVKPKSVAEWLLICDRQDNREWAQWIDELEINLNAILDTEAAWTGFSTLRQYASNFKTFDEFMLNINAELDEIKSEGVWDVDGFVSPVYNEKASVAHYVASSGMDKGKRSCSAQYKYGKKQYWYNYEVLPVDVLTEYLHLSYLKSIGYKPLQRIVTDGTDYGEKVFFEFDEEDCEQGLTVTPLYEDPYFKHEGELDNERLQRFNKR